MTFYFIYFYHLYIKKGMIEKIFCAFPILARIRDPLFVIEYTTTLRIKRREREREEKSNGKSPLLELLMWSLYAELCPGGTF